jgi:hypothetical protein
MISKEEQKQLLTEIMEADAKDGLYKQMTAVEWFSERIQSDVIFNFEKVLQQAKQMEKEQIIKAVDSNFEYILNSSYPTLGEQYYNKIYNK